MKEQKKMNRMIRRAAAAALTAVLLLSAVGCGSKEAAGTSDGQQTQEQAQGEKGSGEEKSPVSEAPASGNAAEEAPASGNAAGEAAVSSEGEAEAAGEEDVSLGDIEIPEVPRVRDDGGVTMDVFAMDTYMNLLAYGDNAEEAVVAAAAEIHRLDDMLSTGNAGSEISKLNAAGGGEVSDVVLSLIEESQVLYKDTRGLFDIAIYPVMKLWGFPTQEFRVPEKAEIDAALKLADASKITIGAQAAPAPGAAEKTAAPAAAAEGNTGAPASVEEGNTGAETAAAEEQTASAETPASGDKSAGTEREAGAGQEAAETPASADQGTGTEKEAGAGQKAGKEQDSAKKQDSSEEKDSAKEQKSSEEQKSVEEKVSAEVGTAAAATTGEQAAAATSESAAADHAAAEAAGAAQTEAAAAVRFGIAGMEIDLGGIAKGYTSSRVMEIFKEHGIEHGIVSLGGNVQAIGTKENGKAWRVAIQNPESDLDYLGVLDISDKCVITSGGYERFFDQDGVRYHHIIDPRTGFPADSGVISATIVSEDGTLADGLSTSLFIMGLEAAEKYWRANSDRFDFILEDKSGKLYVTEGVADILTTNAKTEIIRK